MSIDVTCPDALALRALQKLDYVLGYKPGDARQLVVAAEDALGGTLGLVCNGVREDPPFGYSHDGDTCLIHEWLVDDDYVEVATLPRTGVPS